MRIHKLITLAFTIHSGGLVLSQSDTLNTYNARGKKDGYWLVYFDKHLQKVDSTKAFYYGFDLYVDGANRTEIFSMKRIDTSRIEHVNRLTAKSGTFTLLDGDFVYYGKRGKIKLVDSFKNGNPLSKAVYFIDSDVPTPNCLEEYVDFTKKFNNQKGSFYIEYKFCNIDKGESFWSMKKGKKWKLVKIKDFKLSERDQQTKEKIK